jgi:hypothetical protein
MSSIRWAGRPSPQSDEEDGAVAYSEAAAANEAGVAVVGGGSGDATLPGSPPLRRLGPVCC